MAGGRASRFSGRVEKATLEVGDSTLLERSIRALNEGGVEKVIVSVTDRVPGTKALANELGVEVNESEGLSYHEDVLDLLESYPCFLSLNVDVPFVTGDHVREIARCARSSSLAAVIPASMALLEPHPDSLLRDGEGRKMLWIGMNVVTHSVEMTLKVFEDPLLSINVNNEEDLAFARRLSRDRGL